MMIQPTTIQVTSLTIQTASLEFTVPEEALTVEPWLVESIRDNGIVAPIVVCGVRVVDGIKRIIVLRSLGIDAVPIVNKEDDVFKLRWMLNLHRSWNLVETALMFQRLDSGLREPFCETLNLGYSPRLFPAFAFIETHPSFWAQLKSGALTVPMLRDLSHAGEHMASLVEKLLSLKGTSGEKRLICGLIRQCAVKGVPHAYVAGCLMETDCAQKLRETLDKLVRPRRAEALERYHRHLEMRRFPKGVRIEIDPTLEQPGVTVHVHLKRDETIKLNQLKDEMDTLFHELEFL